MNLAFMLALAGPLADQPNDEAYTAKILEYTTEPFFLTEMVDHLPASDTVPTPLDYLGHIVGAPNVLSYSWQTQGYLRELSRASPRVKFEIIGTSEEGKDIVVAIISSEENMAKLDRYKEINGLLGDPRKISDEEAEELIDEALPMYWMTGGMHAPETGPPEMVMELAYRLVVSELPMIQDIRKNAIVMITPVLDVDGRDRVVDIYLDRKRNPDKPATPLVYWGKYVAHDDNRDAMLLSLELSKAVTRHWLEYKPLVFHDLHEASNYLYISTGTGPYNPWLDPIVIDEWHELAYNEVGQMTRRGVPGVWTHDFYDGWAASYGFTVAHGHNGIGRFYETFSAGGADTGVRTSGSNTRAWFRPNPAFPKVRWSIRNNTNLMQSGVLLGLHKIGTERRKFMRNFWLKSKRSVEKPWNEGPAAYVFPADEKRKGNQRLLLEGLQQHGIEVHRLSEEFTDGDITYSEGSLVVRMDQPYSRLVDMLLDKQYYNPNDPRSYDDTGWQLGPLFNVEVTRVVDTDILESEMSDWSDPVFIPWNGPMPSAVAMKPLADAKVSAAQLRNSHELSWLQDDYRSERLDVDIPNGSAILPLLESGRFLLQSYEFDVWNYHFAGTGLFPHEVAELTARQAVPARIALVHTWQSTQDEGWARIALDNFGIEYDYVSVHELRDTPFLRDKYDVILMPQTRGTGRSIVAGRPMVGDPIPWKPTVLMPNLGGPDTSDDIRGGIELEGVLNLRNFVQSGGLLVCIGNMARIPIEFGIVSGVSIQRPVDLNAPGGVFLTERADDDSMVLEGFDDTLAVYFNGNSLPVLAISSGGGRRRFGGGGGSRGRVSGRGSLTDPDIVQGRGKYVAEEKEGDSERPGPGPRLTAPRVLLRYAAEKDLLVAGMLVGGDELAGKPALIDCKVGEGHVLLFSFNPFWRGQTVGSYPLFFNAALFRDELDPEPEEDEEGDGS